MKEFEQIVIDPEVCHGKLIIKGTRIMLSNILSLLAGGYTIEQIIVYYLELAEKDVKAAIAYAAAFIDDELMLTSTSSSIAP